MRVHAGTHIHTNKDKHSVLLLLLWMATCVWGGSVHVTFMLGNDYYCFMVHMCKFLTVFSTFLK